MGLADLPDKRKAGRLGTWIGEQGREIYKTFEWIEGEKDDPNKVLDKFELYIHPRKTKRVARRRLFKRKQSSEESFDDFVKDLNLILLDCEYVQSEDVLVDAIIQGAYEEKVQE